LTVVGVAGLTATIHHLLLSMASKSKKQKASQNNLVSTSFYFVFDAHLILLLMIRDVSYDDYYYVDSCFLELLLSLVL
jgi:hypothetical protein